jgi:hypothetical protein
MKVCGFSFIRNAVQYSYPVVEAIQSILPVCDKFVVNVGKSQDGTRELIASIDSDKIEIFESVWDDRLNNHGEVLSVETNKALKRIPEEYDWAFYIQADEILHEKYLAPVRNSMEHWLENPEVEGLLFRYRHFYGSYDYTADSRSWYRNEIRIVRNDSNIRSYRDAQGFRIHNRKIRVKPADATMYHYGWVRHPQVMQKKNLNFNTLYHDREWVERRLNNTELFDYSRVESVQRFTGTHPEIMQERISRQNWQVKLDENRKRFGLVDRILYWIEHRTGKRLFEYRNYKEI